MGDADRALLPEGVNDRRSGRDRRVSSKGQLPYLGELDSRRFPRREEDFARCEEEGDQADTALVHLLLAEQCRKMANDTHNLETRRAFLEMAEDYDRLGSDAVRTTADIAKLGGEVRATCRTCSHTKLIPSETLDLWFEEPVELERAGNQLRCPKCKQKGTTLKPIPA